MTIPIIALTANAFDEDVQRSMQAGLNAHLSKPVKPDVLSRRWRIWSSLKPVQSAQPKETIFVDSVSSPFPKRVLSYT